MEARLPTDSQRLCIVGATGTGKTYAAVWHLSKRSFTTRPWIVYDFKGDELLGKIDAPEISVFDPPPTEPGIYFVRPLPHQIDEVSAQMMQIWKQRNIGVYVDEGYMLGRNNPGYRALLTQGRSRSIPLITLVQRPVMIDRFVFSEASFFQIFRLQSMRDEDLIADFIPMLRRSASRAKKALDFETELDEHESYYYDVGRNTLNIFEKVPDEDAILDTIDTRLQTIRQVA